VKTLHWRLVAIVLNYFHLFRDFFCFYILAIDWLVEEFADYAILVVNKTKVLADLSWKLFLAWIAQQSMHSSFVWQIFVLRSCFAASQFGSAQFFDSITLN